MRYPELKYAIFECEVAHSLKRQTIARYVIIPSSAMPNNRGNGRMAQRKPLPLVAINIRDLQVFFSSQTGRDGANLVALRNSLDCRV